MASLDHQSGKLLFENVFTNYNYLVQWILSYGEAVKVIEPCELVNEIRKKAKNMLAQYEE
ncbi:WYL domain-containing protein [Robinsoniella peoriensis]|uniref:WYL domain-containing protein n=1 Tax=Robinsoniella peoriensis TaxID=180332 RepID=UPI001FA79FD8|nr:WYL domain-containing protein [Robinsoniella peoriensis]